MRQRLAAVAGLLVLGGCASLGEQIQHQQAIIQRCDVNPGIHRNSQTGRLASAICWNGLALLPTARCKAACLGHPEKDNKTQWKALCELDEILLRNEFKICRLHAI
jgi:hypothetical protein